MNTDSARKIRILLVDDHTLFREGVARLLGAEPQFDLVAHCGSIQEALEVLASKPIDMVLLDWDFGNEKGSELILQARERGYQVRILILTAGVSDAEAKQLLTMGAAGIFLKHGSPEVLSRSILRVMEGGVWLDQRRLTAVLQHQAPPERDAVTRLTERESEVLRSILAGLANKEIARRLQVSESAVKAVLQQLFHKTGVRTRSQLVRIALEQHRDRL